MPCTQDSVYTHRTLRPAVLCFAGDTYQGLDAASLEAEEMGWAQEHLR